MRELFTSLLLASCLIPIAAGGMQLTSELMEPSAPHGFADLHSEPLWSSEVKRVDPSSQAYERLPAALSANTMVAEVAPVERKTMMLGSRNTADEASKKGVPSDVLFTQLQSAKAQHWCSTRYRTYDPADNTYQPHGGGPRRNCAVPSEITAPSVQQVADISGTEEPDANAQWCIQRYSSYRIEDNTYQPFSGGRRQCPGPDAQSASNYHRTSSIAKF